MKFLSKLQNKLKILSKLAKETQSAGLDIGSSSVKLVKLKFSKDKAELAGFCVEPLAGTDLETTLKKISKAQNLSSANISISGPSTIIRYADFPRMSSDEFRQALKFEAQKYIPFPLIDVNLDGAILKEDFSNNKMFVLLAAAKKELVNSRIKSCEIAGIKANNIDSDSVALINAFNFNNPSENNLKDKAIALLNVGAEESNLNILENSLPRLSRDIHIAGNNFTQKIADFLNLDPKAAEALKINPDKENTDKLNSAAEAVFSNLAKEIHSSFDYYESQSTTSVGKIFLSGGCAFFAGLKDMLFNLTGIPVECWDPLKEIVVSDGADSAGAKAVSPQLAVALGLALRR